MRALIDYTVRQNIRNVTDLSVTIEAVAVSNQITTFRVNSHELATPKKLQVPKYLTFKNSQSVLINHEAACSIRILHLQIPNAFGTVKVQAKGAGYAILQMQVQYGVDRSRFVTEPPVPAFSLSTQGKFGGRNASLIEYISCQRYDIFY